MWHFNEPSYAEWCALVEDALLYEAAQMSNRKSDFHDLDEDALSATLLVALNNLALDASGRVVNGNCDLTIKRGDYLWLGEAKIAGNTSNIHGGYLQLRDRYDSGVAGQDRGGMVIYCQTDSTKAVLAGWRAALEKVVPSSAPKDHPSSALAFTSSDTSPVTGETLSLIHIAFPLFHKPTDPTATLPADAAQASRLAKARVKADDPDGG